MRKSLKLISGLVALVAMPHVARSAVSQEFHVTTLSSRPEMVSGGDVLVEIDVPQNVPLNKPTVRLNGRDITSALHPDQAAHVLVGLVEGLKLGENVLEVFRGQGNRAAQVTIKNYPISGPIFSGSQEQPFVCQTQDFKLPDGSSLGPSLDANCSVKTVVTYVYKSTMPAPAAAGVALSATGLKPLPSMSALPSDVAWTTTSTGERVPYVVRVETGTINRGIYQFAVLHDPTKEPQPGPLTPPKAWNKRLLYSFGSGCNGGWYMQGTSIGTNGGLVKDAIVGRGYAEASSTLNVFGNNCNSVIAAETMMMVKERFIKAYGKPVFTISWGGSGGSEQQLPIADNYPGLLDGIVPGRTFPDVLANAQLQIDSQLLYRYYTKVGEALSEKQKLAILGEARVKDFTTDIDRIRSAGTCPAQLPKSQTYDLVANRTGVRCDVFDHTVDVFGRDPATGYARRPVDNIGLQYGLEALNAGVISTAQFLDLNQNVGGYDNDGNIVPIRSVADPLALRAAYQKGQVTNGGLGLAKLPIVDVRPFRDLLPPEGDIHMKFHSFSLRERLLKANGTFANEVLLVGPVSRNLQMDVYAVEKMDEWLTRLAKDTSSDRVIDKVIRAKPADLVDSCLTEAGDRIIEPQTPAGGKCNELYPTFKSPRMLAGGPASNDILKCQLKPIDYRDYKVPFSDTDRARLQAIFPGGVCDWSKPGAEQQAPTGTWLSY
jgi:hypothetical protein